MKRFTNLLLPILAGLGFLIMSSLYVVDEREKALRLWFGEVTAVIVDPGLNFKVQSWVYDYGCYLTEP